MLNLTYFIVSNRSATKKPGRGESGSEWWHENDDISDFDLSDASDYSYNDEDKLCNTMLLTGPVGCGKTSAVYACAEELGFKVRNDVLKTCVLLCSRFFQSFSF